MKLVFFLVFITLCFGFDFDLSGIKSSGSFDKAQSTTLAKKKALIVLENKCISCHLKKNRSVIFNLQNMSKKARDIHTQVFVKKRMPKGKVKLNPSEFEILRIWLAEELK